MLEQAEERDLFLTRLDDEGEWFRYHHLFAEFLRRRLDRDHPGRAVELHRVAAEWFAGKRLLSQAVDQWLAAGDDARAVDLVERDGNYLLKHSRMTTTLAVISKLPAAAVATSPRVQVFAAWANILLQRTAPAEAALSRVRAALVHSASADADDIRIEADIVNGVATAHCDRVDGIEDLIAEGLARFEQLRPWVATAVANVASFAALYRFDFAEVRRLQEWAIPHHERTGGKFGVMYGHCMAGIAIREQLDFAGAEREFRTALRFARRSDGAHSHAARIAGALLGEILYERNETNEAGRLFDEAGQLGLEGGIVEILLARFATAARVLALRGDRAAAAQLLDRGAHSADVNALPRLRARIDYERVMLGFRPETEAVTYATRRRAHGGIEEVTAQLRGCPRDPLRWSPTPHPIVSTLPAAGRGNGRSTSNPPGANSPCCVRGAYSSPACRAPGEPTRRRPCSRRSRPAVRPRVWSASCSVSGHPLFHCCNESATTPTPAGPRCRRPSSTRCWALRAREWLRSLPRASGATGNCHRLHNHSRVPQAPQAAGGISTESIR